MCARVTSGAAYPGLPTRSNIRPSGRSHAHDRSKSAILIGESGDWSTKSTAERFGEKQERPQWHGEARDERDVRRKTQSTNTTQSAGDWTSERRMRLRQRESKRLVGATRLTIFGFQISVNYSTGMKGTHTMRNLHEDACGLGLRERGAVLLILLLQPVKQVASG